MLTHSHKIGPSDDDEEEDEYDSSPAPDLIEHIRIGLGGLPTPRNDDEEQEEEEEEDDDDDDDGEDR